MRPERGRIRKDPPSLWEPRLFGFRGVLVYRKTRRTKAPPAISPAPKPSVSSESISLAASGCRLVDLLVTGSRVRGAHGDGGANLLELKLVGGGTILENVGHVLGVTGVADTLDAYALGGVVALLGGCERLIELAALAFLLGLLGDLGYGRDGRQGQHRQQRRQQHHLPQLLLLISSVFGPGLGSDRTGEDPAHGSSSGAWFSLDPRDPLCRMCDPAPH